jgi:D-alanyl-D-alanine carboxypeptidase
MNDYYIPDNIPEAPKNTLPIVPQLIVLGIVFVGIFSALFIHFTLSGQNLETANALTAPIAVVPLPDPLVPQKLAEVDVLADAAYVFDVREQRVLFSKNSDEPVPLASITKLMTSLLAFELIEDDETAAITAQALSQDGDSGFIVGERFSVAALQKLTLIPSSNDAAYALGAAVGTLLGDGDPYGQFIAGMNIRAQELGLSSLSFKNTTGLDISSVETGGIGSAKDVTFLMEYILTHHPDIIAPTTRAATRVYNTDGEFHDVENTNDFISRIPNLLGSKTGYTDLAGGNLTIAYDLGFNRPIIITVLGSSRQGRFTDVTRLVAAVEESLQPTE